MKEIVQLIHKFIKYNKTKLIKKCNQFLLKAPMIESRTIIVLFFSAKIYFKVLKYCNCKEILILANSFATSLKILAFYKFPLGSITLTSVFFSDSATVSIALSICFGKLLQIFEFCIKKT